MIKYPHFFYCIKLEIRKINSPTFWENVQKSTLKRDFKGSSDAILIIDGSK
jgi:hypothetical protein